MSSIDSNNSVPKYDYSCSLCYRNARNELYRRIVVSDAEIMKLSRDLENQNNWASFVIPLRRLCELDSERFVLFSSENIRHIMASMDDHYASKILRLLTRRNMSVHKLLLQHEVFPSLLNIVTTSSVVGEENEGSDVLEDVCYALGHMGAVAENKDVQSQIGVSLARCVTSAKGVDVGEASIVALSLLILQNPLLLLDATIGKTVFHALSCLVGGTLFVSSLSHTAICCILFAGFRVHKSREFLLKEGLHARLPAIAAAVGPETSTALFNGLQQLLVLGGTPPEKLEKLLDPEEASPPLATTAEAAAAALAAEERRHNHPSPGISSEVGLAWTPKTFGEDSSDACRGCKSPLKGNCVVLADGDVLHDGCFCCEVCSDGFDDAGRYWLHHGRVLCHQHYMKSAEIK